MDTADVVHVERLVAFGHDVVEAAWLALFSRALTRQREGASFGQLTLIEGCRDHDDVDNALAHRLCLLQSRDDFGASDVLDVELTLQRAVDLLHPDRRLRHDWVVFRQETYRTN